MPKINITDKTLINKEHLINVCLDQQKHHPSKIAFRFLENGEHESKCLTYETLVTRAKAVAAKLQIIAEPGDRFLLLYEPGLDFIEAFLGCLFAKMIPVPAYPPTTVKNAKRLTNISNDCKPAGTLTSKKTMTLIQNKQIDLSQFKLERSIITDEISNAMAGEWLEPTIKPDDIAFLQYTSGSTGHPKGVIISHKNILTNITMFKTAMNFDDQSIMVSWLPVFHDMGLIGCILGPLAIGFASVLMSPLAFLEKPARWFLAVTRFRATVTGGPNFAFDLCNKKIDNDTLSKINLLSLNVLFNGAEPVKPKTLEAFKDKFSKAGFNSKALFPCYGLAETTLITSGGPYHSGDQVISLQKDRLEKNMILTVHQSDSKKMPLVACGNLYTNEDIKIVQPETSVECKPDQIGEIWIAGDHIAQGYWHKPEETKITFKATIKGAFGKTYLRTGDLGFIKDDQLFVCGRIKDLIIINGFNHHPQDIEQTVESCSAIVRSGCVVVYCDQTEHQEKLIIVAEVDRKFLNSNLPKEADHIAANVMKDHEIAPEKIYFVKTAQIPKTSSGKIQRNLTKKAIAETTLECLDTWQATGKSDAVIMSPAALTLGAGSSKESQRNSCAHSLQNNTPQSTINCQEIVQNLIHWLLKLKEYHIQDIDPSVSLTKYGFDSVAIISLQSYVEETFKIKLPQNVFYENPNLNDLADFISKEQKRVA